MQPTFYIFKFVNVDTFFKGCFGFRYQFGKLKHPKKYLQPNSIKKQWPAFRSVFGQSDQSNAQTRTQKII